MCLFYVCDSQTFLSCAFASYYYVNASSHITPLWSDYEGLYLPILKIVLLVLVYSIQTITVSKMHLEGTAVRRSDLKR
jgi:hypothetical protein